MRVVLCLVFPLLLVSTSSTSLEPGDLQPVGLDRDAPTREEALDIIKEGCFPGTDTDLQAVRMGRHDCVQDHQQLQVARVQ